MMRDPRDELLVQIARGIEMLLDNCYQTHKKSSGLHPSIVGELAVQCGRIKGSREILEAKDRQQLRK